MNLVLEVGDGEVHVWVVRLPGTDAASARPARDALARLVARYASEARLEHRAGRRPTVHGAPLHVSLARSGELALVAVAAGTEVGVDLERVVPAPPSAVVSHLLSDDEAEALRELAASERDVAFARAWVRKEAALKAAGVGLAVEPPLVEVGVEASLPRRVAVPGHGTVVVADLEVVPDHAAAVAVSGSAHPVVRVRRTSSTVR